MSETRRSALSKLLHALAAAPLALLPLGKRRARADTEPPTRQAPRPRWVERNGSLRWLYGGNRSNGPAPGTDIMMQMCDGSTATFRHYRGDPPNTERTSPDGYLWHNAPSRQFEDGPRTARQVIMDEEKLCQKSIRDMVLELEDEET